MGRTIGMAWSERHQAALYLAAVAIGGLVSAFFPGSAVLSSWVSPVLIALLFVTFLSVPFHRIAAGWRDTRFLAVIGVVNFVLVPGVVFVLSRFVAQHEALLLGMLLVLLTPCVDYVIVFTGLAGGAADRLLAAAPLLMAAQLVLLPLFLVLFLGEEARGIVQVGPFAEAFVLFIVVPAVAAALVQVCRSRSRVARVVDHGGRVVMIPLMMLTLFLVVAAHARADGERGDEPVLVVPIYVAFIVVLVVLGTVVARLTRAEVPEARAIVFSGVTRNSLVVLPLAFAVGSELTPLVVVTQTLVELLGMILLVRTVPAIIPARRSGMP